MKPDPVKKLSDHMKRILGKEAHRSDLIDILRLARLILEQEKTGSAYPVLHLYCNWVLHTKIDRQPQAWEVLERINDVALAHGHTKDMSIVCTEVSKAIELDVLRKNIESLFSSKSIPTDLTDSLGNWKAFTGRLLDELTHQPIRFPEDVETNKKAKGRAVFDRMVAKRSASGAPMPNFVPRAFYFTNRSQEPAEPGRPPGFYWHIRFLEQAPHFAELNGLLHFTEERKDFNRD